MGDCPRSPMRGARTDGRFGESPQPANSWCRGHGFHRRRGFFFLRHERELRRDRMIALQPNQKIKYPHPPANGKTVADISAKYRVHCWRKSEHIPRCQKYFNKFLRVPGINKAKIDIHRPVDRALITREEPFCLSRMIKSFI